MYCITFCVVHKWDGSCQFDNSANIVVIEESGTGNVEDYVTPTRSERKLGFMPVLSYVVKKKRDNDDNKSPWIKQQNSMMMVRGRNNDIKLAHSTFVLDLLVEFRSAGARRRRYGGRDVTRLPASVSGKNEKRQD